MILLIPCFIVTNLNYCCQGEKKVILDILQNLAAFKNLIFSGPFVYLPKDNLYNLTKYD